MCTQLIWYLAGNIMSDVHIAAVYHESCLATDPTARHNCAMRHLQICNSQTVPQSSLTTYCR